MAEQNKRQIAYKTFIKKILEGDYVKMEGWEPNYILTGSGLKVSRVNIMATVISIQPGDASFSSMIIDDGSGKISVRSFGENTLLKDISVGSTVLVVGRPRLYNNETYIIPEIVKKVENKRWVVLRKLELEQEEREPTAREEKKEEKDEKSPAAGNSQEVCEDEIEKICAIIRKKDSGKGADIQEVIAEAAGKNTDKIVSNLLLEGEVFEVSPGRIKILD